MSRSNARPSSEVQPLSGGRHYRLVDNRSAPESLHAAGLEVVAAHSADTVITGEVVAAEKRLTVEQFAAPAASETTDLEAALGLSRGGATVGRVMRVTATEVVVHSSAYLEPYRLSNNTVRDSGVGHPRWVDAEPTEVAPGPPQPSAEQIDAAYGAWTRGRSGAGRLLGSL